MKYRNRSAQAAVDARAASFLMSASSEEKRNKALEGVIRGLHQSKDRILKANDVDLQSAEDKGLSDAVIARLRFDMHKIDDLCSGIEALITMRDPLGRIQIKRELAKGLILTRLSCPIGVVGIIFESRPDALIQIGSLCLKSGNCVLLKGGREAQETNRVLFEVLNDAGKMNGMPDGWTSLLETHEDVSEMLKMDEQIDLIIPRGSGSFVRYIKDNTRIPVLGHSEGICHLYIDRQCDTNKAVQIAVDAKTQYPSACNAIETILWHADAKEVLLTVAHALNSKDVLLTGDEHTKRLLKENGIESAIAKESSWRTEYLSNRLNLKCVNSLQEAIHHINEFGSHHTDVILTENEEAWREFSLMVDSAGVYRNCSSRFADGYRYGFGAEVGISTGRLHARGPMGLEGLCTYKYILEGQGDIVADFADGRRSFTHKDLELR